MGKILWGIIVVLLVIWLLGFLFKVAGGLIHIFLIVAAIVLLFQLFTSYRSRRRL